MNTIDDTWNLSPLLKGDDDPAKELLRKEIAQNAEHFIEKWSNRCDYLSEVSVLTDALQEYEELLRSYGTGGNELYYFQLRSSQEENNSGIKANLSKIIDFSTKLHNKLQFFELNLATIESEKSIEFLQNDSIKKYQHFLERLVEGRKFLLGESEEQILNLKSGPAFLGWIKMLSGFISKQERTVIDEDGISGTKSFSELQNLISSKNKTTRDSAAKALNDIYEKLLDTAEAEINAVLGDKKINDELRGYDRPDQARHKNDDIPTEVVDTLIDQVSQRYDISRRFYKLKASLLGQTKLSYHERNVEYGELDGDYPFDKACQLVSKALNSLDPEFKDIFDGFLKNDQFDVYPRSSKRSGAFCAGQLISQPTYILLNHTNRLQDVLTLAHEVGHGINNELIKQSQNSLHFDTPLSTAEVASTFMEDFVLQEVLKNCDENERLAIQMLKLNDDISTIFRQVACYKFEQELHQTFRERGYLSGGEIGVIFQSHMTAYMGDSVEQSVGSENWWVAWHHIRQFFYVYSYASGLLISKSLQAMVQVDKSSIDKIKTFLSTGTSVSPQKAFEGVGIFITEPTFWNKGLAEIETLLDETEKLARKLGKLS